LVFRLKCPRLFLLLAPFFLLDHLPFANLRAALYGPPSGIAAFSDENRRRSRPAGESRTSTDVVRCTIPRRRDNFLGDFRVCSVVDGLFDSVKDLDT